jgi:DNA polymerase epsilon subunit 4
MSLDLSDPYLVARVKKIIHADDEVQSCSNNAAFVITIATEMFIQHLVERTHEIVKAEKRPRRNVQYGDVGKLFDRRFNYNDFC